MTAKQRQTLVVLKEDKSLTIKVVSQNAIEITVEERQPKKRQTHILWKILKLLRFCLRLCKAINEDRGDEIVHTVKMVFDKVMDALFDWDFINISWSVFLIIFLLHMVIKVCSQGKELVRCRKHINSYNTKK